LCERWVENPYFQYFCGEAFFRHDLPLDRSSLTRWRQRMSRTTARRIAASLSEHFAASGQTIVAADHLKSNCPIVLNLLRRQCAIINTYLVKRPIEELPDIVVSSHVQRIAACCDGCGEWRRR
jgi:hypothetical protein